MLKHVLFQSKSFVRFQHCTAISLNNRALIQLNGNDSSKFLQGLITNDIEFLKNTNAIYSMLLNARGRILYDMIIYKQAQQNQSSYLIEISRNAVADFLRLLRRYKLRTQVSFEDVTELYRIWSIFSYEKQFSSTDDLRESLNFKTRQGLIIGQSDPRHPSLGIRLITENQTQLDHLIDLHQISDDTSIYKQWLYRNGIAEGIEDIPPGECIPLEYNIVFLNGVSFNKGCYVGQELVARTHHTGVIRKRLMPVEIENYEELSKNFENKTDDLTIINDETKRRAGKLRTSIEKYGLGLIRLSEWKSPLRIQNADVKIKPSIPNWWPTLDEATKSEMKLDTNIS